MKKSLIRMLTRLGPHLWPVVVDELVLPSVRVVAKKVVEWMERGRRDGETDQQPPDQPPGDDRGGGSGPYEAIREELVEVRDAVRDAPSRKIDLREYMQVEGPAWKLYVGVCGLPGYTTRKPTVLARLDTVIAGLDKL